MKQDVILALYQLAAALQRELEYINAVEAASYKELTDIEQAAKDQVFWLTGSYDVQVGIRNAQEDAAGTLRRMESDLADLFKAQDAVKQALEPPPPLEVRVTNFYDVPKAQRGVKLAEGGMVPAMVEPGESWWAGLTQSQDRALAAVNAAFPRFATGGIVPGQGSGDIVAGMFPEGTRILNRVATDALLAGGRPSWSMPPMPALTFTSRSSAIPRFQEGGQVQGNGTGQGTTEVHHHHNTFSFPNLQVRSDRDKEEIKRIVMEAQKEYARADLLFRRR